MLYFVQLTKTLHWVVKLSLAKYGLKNLTWSSGETVPVEL